MDFNLTSEQASLYNSSILFAERVIAPNLQTLEEDLLTRRMLFRKMAELGLFTMCVPKSEGGSAIDSIGYVLALKAIAKIDAGISVAMAVSNMVSESIYRFGTEQLKKKYIPLIKSGECVPLAFALTEKNAGSDVKSIQAKAEVDSDDSGYYVLNGEKQFITNGDMAGALIVMAKMNLKNGTEGISAFLVDGDNPGINVVKQEKKMGLITANLVDLRFEQLRVPVENLIGEEGQGLKIALSALDSGRIGVAAQSIGISEAAFEAALRFSKDRHQFGQAISENQAIAFKLADMRVKLSASKLLAYKAAWLKDQGEVYVEEASEAKLFCSESCTQITNEALQIHGGYGYIKDYPVEKYFRDGRVTTLYEGTSEIQRLIIARQILSDVFQTDDLVL